MRATIKFRQLLIEHHGGLIWSHLVISKQQTGDGAGDLAAERLDHGLNPSLSKVCAEGDRGSSGAKQEGRVMCGCERDDTGSPRAGRVRVRLYL